MLAAGMIMTATTNQPNFTLALLLGAVMFCIAWSYT